MPWRAPGAGSGVRAGRVPARGGSHIERFLSAALMLALVGIVVVAGGEPGGRSYADPARADTSGAPAASAAVAGPAATSARARGLAPMAPAGLPIAWCGHGLPAGRLAPRATRVFQLVYAHPADQPDHFRQFANELQADASYIDRFIAVESNNAQYMRFAMGTSCGRDDVSLIDWRMPKPRLDYVGVGGDQLTANFPAIDADAVATFGRAAGVDTLIYVDGLVDDPGFGGDTYGGAAEGLDIGDTTPGAGNANNAGGQFAFMWGLVGGRPAPGEEALDPATLLHEASHAIGAVSFTAPNSTGAGHCYVVQDIMCYADGGPHGQAADLRAECPYRNDVMQLPYDCDGQNYYNPDPPPGSYLATHWNLYDSDFMAPCSSDERACGTPQGPLEAIARRGPSVLTLTAITLASRTVSLLAGVRGLPTHASTTICLSSRFFYPLNPPCRTTRAPGAPRLAIGRIGAANGEGLRAVTAIAWIRVPARYQGPRHARTQPIRLTLELP